MKPVRIFRHLACEGPGYLGEVMSERGIDYQLACIDEGHTVPASLDDVSGLVFMGGSMSVNDPLDWIGQEVDLIKRARAQGLPMLGLCLGGQLLSKAYGAKIVAGENGQEIGWHDVERIDSMNDGDWLADLPTRMPAFHWHGETFDLPEGAQLLLSSDCYHNQAWAYGNTLALQCHPEMTANMVREWTQVYAADLAKGGTCNQPVDEIVRKLDEKIGALRPFASQLFNRWLDRLVS